MKVRRFLLLVSVVLVLTMTFAPGLWTLIWHVFHGKSVIYKTKRIPVPLRWIANVEPQSANLVRLAFTVFPDKPVEAFISFQTTLSPLGKTHAESAESFISIYWTNLAKNGLVIGPVNVTAGTGETVCMESSPKNDPDLLNISCLVLEDRWIVSLNGKKADRSEFYELLKKIH
jgi:hypothetical protein